MYALLNNPSAIGVVPMDFKNPQGWTGLHTVIDDGERRSG